MKEKTYGKKVGSCIYVSWRYMRILPKEIKAKICTIESKNMLDDYDYIKWDKKTGNISLCWTEDWDNQDEPVVVKTICFTSKKPYAQIRVYTKNNPVIHGKHLFSYPGAHDFDYARAERRFNKLQTLNLDKKRIGFKDYWNSVKHLLDEWEAKPNANPNTMDVYKNGRYVTNIGTTDPNRAIRLAKELEA